MRLRFLAAPALAGVLALALAGCTGDTGPVERELSGQIQLPTDSGDIYVSYENVEEAPATDIPKLKELNPGVTVFDDYKTLYIHMAIDTNVSDKSVVLNTLAGKIVAFDGDQQEVGALPETAGTACDGTVLEPVTGSPVQTYCKTVLIEPTKDISKVGISELGSGKVYDTPPAKEDDSK